MKKEYLKDISRMVNTRWPGYIELGVDFKELSESNPDYITKSNIRKIFIYSKYKKLRKSSVKDITKYYPLKFKNVYSSASIHLGYIHPMPFKFIRNNLEDKF